MHLLSRVLLFAGLASCGGAAVAVAATRLGLEASVHRGAVGLPDQSPPQSPPDEGRQAMSWGLGPVVERTFGQGWAGSVAVRYDELAYGSHEFAIGIVGGTDALWTDGTTSFRQLTLAPGLHRSLWSGLQAQLSLEAGYLISARQTDELVPGPMPASLAALGPQAANGAIFEQVGSLSERDVTDAYRRLRSGLSAGVAYELPAGRHALRIAAAWHRYAASARSGDRTYSDWRSSVTWLR